MEQNPKGMSLTLKVVIGMVAGIIIGLAINLANLNTAGGLINEYIVNGLFLVVGKMFIASLKMLVVPLVLFSLITGVCGIGHLSTLGRVGGKSFLLYLLTTAIAIATAISIVVHIIIAATIPVSIAISVIPKSTGRHRNSSSCNCSGNN